MNTSMKIYLVMHKFCNEDYDGNTMLGEEIITSFSTKETAERFVLSASLTPNTLTRTIGLMRANGFLLSLVQTLRVKNCLSLISTVKKMPITLTLTSSTSFTGFPAIATSTVRAPLFAR